MTGREATRLGALALLVCVAGCREPPGASVEPPAAWTAHIRGRIVDERGRPVPCAPLMARMLDAPDGSRDISPREARTDDGGRFALDGLAPGTWSVGSAPVEGLASKEVKLKPGRTVTAGLKLRQYRSAGPRER